MHSNELLIFIINEPKVWVRILQYGSESIILYVSLAPDNETIFMD